jgi:hypothetical protein
MNRKRQLQVSADDVNILGENINKYAGALLDASKEICLEVSAEKIKYMFVSHHQNAGEKHNLMVANKSF